MSNAHNPPAPPRRLEIPWSEDDLTPPETIDATYCGRTLERRWHEDVSLAFMRLEIARWGGAEEQTERRWIAILRLMAFLVASGLFKGENDEEADTLLLRMADMAKRYLRARSSWNITRGWLRRKDPGEMPEHLDIEPPRHIALIAIRDHMRVLLSLNEPEGSGKVQATRLVFFAFEGPSGLSNFLLKQVPGAHRKDFEQTNFDRVLAVVGRVLEKTPQEQVSSQETAERVLVESCIALGVRESAARGLFRFEDQRQKRSKAGPPDVEKLPQSDHSEPAKKP